MTFRPKPPAADQSRPGAESADPFDLWLRRSVHQAYDAVLEEQVPEDLLRLCSDNRTEWVAMKDRWLGTAPEEGAAGATPLGGLPGSGPAAGEAVGKGPVGKALADRGRGAGTAAEGRETRRR